VTSRLRPGVADRAEGGATTVKAEEIDAAYVYVQNQMSVMAEQLTALDEMKSLAKLFCQG
jgi:hypothetical protein